MDLKRKLIGALLAVIAGSGLLMACGPEEGASCAFDTECDESKELCYSGFCSPVCDSQQNCIGDEVCTSRLPATGKVCVSPGSTTTNNPNNPQAECKTTEDCTKKDPNSYCDTVAGICKSLDAAKEYVTVEVRDATTDTDRCKDTTKIDKKSEPSPGTKISYVQLLKADGSNAGWGKEVGYEVSKGDNSFDDVQTVIDGSAPGLTGNCASEGFKVGNGVALSCGGYVMVQFLDSDKKVVKLTKDHSIMVGVYGQVCSPEFDKKGLDKYDVYLCETFAGTNTNNSSCKTKLTSSAINGIGTVNVVIPK